MMIDRCLVEGTSRPDRSRYQKQSRLLLAHDFVSVKLGRDDVVILSVTRKMIVITTSIQCVCFIKDNKALAQVNKSFIQKLSSKLY